MSRVKLECGIEGRFHIVQRCKDGKIKFESEFKNLLMDQGLNVISSTSIGPRSSDCLLLVDNTVPQPNETGQGIDWGYRSSNRVSATQVGEGPEKRSWWRNIYNFAPAADSLNISSVAVGYYASNTGDRILLSRALILDDLGEPTTLSIIEGDYVQVTYYLYLYPSLEDVTGTIVLSGNIGGQYDYIIRVSEVGTYGGTNGFIVGATPGLFFGYVTTTTSRCYTGDIGPVEGIPSGNSNSVNSDTSISALAYTQGSFSRQVRITRGLRSTPIDIRSTVDRVGPFCYQTQFDPPIPKTTADILELTYEVSWARR